MKNFWRVAAVGFLYAATIARAADTPAPTPSVTELIKNYLDGKWDTVGESLRDHAKEFSSLPVEKAQERADVNTIRQAYIECRQGWWAQTKLGNKVQIHPSVWNYPFEAVYDPAITGSQFSNENGSKTYKVSWDSSGMDSNAKGEHGFTKGEITELGIWITLGGAQAWGTIPPTTLLKQDAETKSILSRYMDFRSALAGIYHGSPRVRRWGLFLCLNSYEGKYAKMETAMSRKAIGAMMVVEVLTNPAKYPSIKLPAVAEESGAEEKCAGQIKAWIEKHAWTLAEDKSLREAIKFFAALNTGDVVRTNVVVLPNKLLVSLDPEKDKAFAVKREAWIAKQLAKDAAK